MCGITSSFIMRDSDARRNKICALYVHLQGQTSGLTI